MNIRQHTFSIRLGLLSAVLAILAACPLRAAAEGSVIYVDRNRSGGNGTSWDKAFQTIGKAMNAAGSGAQIWVANGTYRERVTLKSGVMLIGGFSGDETDVAQRDPLSNPVVITSAGLSDVTSGTVVIKGVTGTRLDSVTVTGASSSRAGGGVYCVDADGSNIIASCIIQDNHPLFGTSAGIYCRNASPGIITTVIMNNQGGAQGGGVVCEDGSSPTLMSCTLRGNTGNGIVCGKNCSPKIVNTIIDGSPGAGVLALSPSAAPVFMNNLFNDNGVLMIDGTGKRIADVNTLNLTLSGSSLNVAGDPKFGTSSTSFHIHDGSAAIDHGLLAAALSPDIDLEPRPGSDGKLDIGVDEAPSSFASARDSNPPVSMVKGLPAAAVGTSLDVPWVASDDLSGVSKVMLYYRRNGGAWHKYGTSYAASPIPVGGSAVSSDGFYEFYTRAIDKAGNTEAAPAKADAGVQFYHAFSGGRLYVKPAASGSQTGESWSNALTLTRALQVAAAVPGTVKEVWVAKGTYTPAPAGGDRNASFRLVSGATLYGGFKGDETSLTQRNIKANITTLSGDLNGNDASGIRTDNSRHVVDASGTAATAALDGFTITGGYADGSGDAASGAGVFISGGNATLRNCTITGNRTADRADGQSAALASAGGGAGIFITSSSQPQLLDCVIIGNRTGHGGRTTAGAVSRIGDGGNGAGLACVSSQVTLSGCQVTSNATGYGGSVVTGTAIPGHGGHGAGVFCSDGVVSASRCLIARNTTGAGGLSSATGDQYLGGDGGSGAGLYGVAAKAILSDSTLTANVTGVGASGRRAGRGGSGAGLCFENTTSTLLLDHCAVTKNTTGAGGASRLDPGAGGSGAGLSLARALATVSVCRITSNTTGAGGRDLAQAHPADGGSGGGLFASSTTLVLARATLLGNRTGQGSTNATFGGAGGNGAGLAALASEGTLTNCFIAGNIAGNGGAGLASPETTSNTLTGVGGRGGSGGGVYLAASALPLRYCSIANNVAGAGGNKAAGQRRREGLDGLGGGLDNATTATVQAADVILWGNREASGQGLPAQVRGAVRFTYSDVEGGAGVLAGTGNLDADPQFVNPAALDLHLRAGSPCIDTGSLVRGVVDDIDGESRPFDGDGRGANHGGDGSDDDIGADEYHGTKQGPTLRAITRLDASPTSAATVRYTVGFSGPVRNVDKNDFSLTVSGLGGAAIQSLTGSGTTYTVTLSAGSGNTGSVALNLKDSGTGIIATTGSLPLRAGAFGPAYQVDRVRPQATVITPDPRFDTDTVWPDIRLKGTATDTGSGVARVMVRQDGGPWVRASGTSQWSLAVRLHQFLNRFEVQAFDRAGNASSVVRLDYDYQGIGAGSDVLSYLLGYLPADPAMDRNGDGKVDVSDLLKARQSGQ